MLKYPDDKTQEVLMNLIKEAGGTGPVHFTPAYICDRCNDIDKEAFPYSRFGFSDLCNDCFEHLGQYSDFYNMLGYHFNIEAVCPYYNPESQCSFTWYRDKRGVAIVSGYDPEDDPSSHWLCVCGRFITDGCCHCSCGAEAPWGCDCGAMDDFEDEWEEPEDYYPYPDDYEAVYEDDIGEGGYLD